MEKVNVTPRALEDIFRLQQKLMEHYIRIEGLPSYPLDLTQKTAQRTIKDFKGRIIEELAEAYEVLLGIWVNESDNTNYNKVDSLTQFNEEIADVLHFFIETLIFCGFDPGTIYSYLQGIAGDNPGTESFLNEESAWLTLFRFANFQNMRDGLSYNQVVNFKSFPVVNKALVDTERPDLAGARSISPQIMVTHNEFMWEITFMINKATAYLKHKDWGQSERTANVLAFKQSMLEAFLHFFRYLDFMGQNPIGMFASYYRKNKILQKRIEDGY